MPYDFINFLFKQWSWCFLNFKELFFDWKIFLYFLDSLHVVFILRCFMEVIELSMFHFAYWKLTSYYKPYARLLVDWFILWWCVFIVVSLWFWFDDSYLKRGSTKLFLKNTLSCKWHFLRVPFFKVFKKAEYLKSIINRIKLQYNVLFNCGRNDLQWKL